MDSNKLLDENCNEIEPDITLKTVTRSVISSAGNHSTCITHKHVPQLQLVNDRCNLRPPFQTHSLGLCSQQSQAPITSQSFPQEGKGNEVYIHVVSTVRINCVKEGKENEGYSYIYLVTLYYCRLSQKSCFIHRVLHLHICISIYVQ